MESTVQDAMHMMAAKKSLWDQVSGAPAAVDPSASKTLSSQKLNSSVIASLFASKAKAPPPPTIASTNSSPSKEQGDTGEERYESEFARGFRKELSKRLAEPIAVTVEHENDGGDEETHSDDDDGSYDDVDCAIRESATRSNNVGSSDCSQWW
ncbi:hypothetical protein FI667_g16729, partial [Globisporangium splendens]